MTGDRKSSPGLYDDLQMKLSPGGPRDYADATDGPVRYALVANADGVVLGYLWAAEQDDAADFLPRPAAGIPARQAAGTWVTQLRHGKQRDLTPVQALAELAGFAGNINSGRVVPGSEATAPSLDALNQIAGQS
ncbi:hypothetical protein [Kitasatospora sp. NBC_01266]|uniref:hypothetical protein n=1 Tax=Kitasatospora sp. NBC_01266 TaxID=2903572 RepID=UPI002E2EC3C7|nr:hypothetical protein [Kitasatospora sp. NBC_01266]